MENNIKLEKVVNAIVHVTNELDENRDYVISANVTVNDTNVGDFNEGIVKKLSDEESIAQFNSWNNGGSMNVTFYNDASSKNVEILSVINSFISQASSTVSTNFNINL